jgi:hypothetical protein
MADLVTDFRGAGQAGHRDTPKGGVSRPVPPLVGTNVTSCPVPVPCPGRSANNVRQCSLFAKNVHFRGLTATQARAPHEKKLKYRRNYLFKVQYKWLKTSYFDEFVGEEIKSYREIFGTQIHRT